MNKARQKLKGEEQRKGRTNIRKKTEEEEK